MDQAVIHCSEGIGIWEWASNDQGSEPDVVLACCGDTPTLEILAATSILREHLPELKVRVVNVVDLMKLEPSSEHPHGLSDIDYDSIFTTDKHIVFGFHGYPWLIHRLTYRRTNHNLTSAATRRKAPSPRRSTCGSKTVSTASISSSM
jgi:xylulose-5-phosphate/fructose-6-phosphate phosphoketolase